MAAILDKLPDVHVGRLDVTSVVRETVREVSDDDVPGLAAEMAYHSILALFPFDLESLSPNSRAALSLPTISGPGIDRMACIVSACGAPFSDVVSPPSFPCPTTMSGAMAMNPSAAS